MKEVIKQFSDGVYKFVKCNYVTTAKEGSIPCNKIHIYLRRCVNDSPEKYRWFYIGDLDDRNTPLTIVEQHSGNTSELPDDERTGVPPRHRRGGNWF